MNIERLKRSKKGFTLIEIIVVLVIIAILAAIAIPAMTGWVKKADEGRAIAEARSILVAASALHASNAEDFTSDAALEMAGNPKGDLEKLEFDDDGNVSEFEYVFKDVTVTLGALQK